MIKLNSKRTSLIVEHARCSICRMNTGSAQLYGFDLDRKKALEWSGAWEWFAYPHPPKGETLDEIFIEVHGSIWDYYYDIARSAFYKRVSVSDGRVLARRIFG